MSDDGSVQSIERVFDILEILSTEQKGLGISEIAFRSGLHKSTVHRLVTTLVKRGYISKMPSGNYRVGLKLIEVASYYINSLELQTEARPYLQEIASSLNLTAHLGILDRHEVIYIEKMDVFSCVRLYSQIGFRVPAYCSSLGKCLLSRFTPTELPLVLKDCNFVKYTPRTIANVEELSQHLQMVRRQGWAMDDREYDNGHRCIAAPIYDYRGEIIAAVSASGATSLLTDDRILATAEFIIGVADKISRSMGNI